MANAPIQPPADQSPRRVRLKDIARAANVTEAAASMAFRGHPRVSAALREKVRRLAAQMGYEPDAAARALAVNSASRRLCFRGTIALLVGESAGDSWRRYEEKAPWLAGLEQHAQAGGFKAEVFAVPADAAGQRRVQRVLRARGVCGLLLNPHGVAPASWRLEWHEWPAVALWSAWGEPAFHTVTGQCFLDAILAVRKLAAAGYRRPALIVEGFEHAPSLIEWKGGFQVAVAEAGLDAPPALINQHHDSDQAAAYLREHKPDVVVGSYGDWLRRELASISPETAYLGLDVGPSWPGIAGIHKDRAHHARVACDLLVAEIQRNSRGPAREPYRLEIPGHWTDGESLPSRSTARRPRA